MSQALAPVGRVAVMAGVLAAAVGGWWLGGFLAEVAGLDGLWPLGPVGGGFAALTGVQLLLDRLGHDDAAPH